MAPLKKHTLILMISLVAVAAGCGDTESGVLGSATCSETDPTVDTTHGPVCGVLGSGGFPDEDTTRPVWAYQGIPYAATTGGNHRWTLATDPIPWMAPRASKHYGPECTQLVDETVYGSDDCLSVNVFTPVAPGGDGSLPVMVFLHGGAYYMGSNSQSNYDGSNLAGGGNLVLVTINYRLGVLGFLGGFGTGDAVDGNLGLKDQQKALQWVRDNIAAFGGNPDNVTIFGLSAGASSVGIHLVNSESKALFTRAIMQSNHYGMLFQNRKTANRRAAKLARAMKCTAGDEDTQLSCLRAAADKDIAGLMKTAGPTKLQQVEALLCNAFGGVEYWAPMIDGHFVLKQPVDTVIDKPFMTGTVRDEGAYFVALTGQYPKFPLPLISITWPLFGNAAIQIDLRYAADNRQDFFHYRGRLMAKILTDYGFHCANNHVVNAAIKAGNQEIYGYYFKHRPSLSIYPYKDETKASPGYFCSPGSGTVCHGNDIPYTFGTPVGFNEPGTDTPAWIGFEEDELPVTGSVMRYWTSYAADGTPDVDGGFPQFTSHPLPAGVYQQLAAQSEGGIVPVTGVYADAKCELWEEVGWGKNWLQEVCSEWLFVADEPGDTD